MYLRVHISYAMRSSALAQNNPQVVHLIFLCIYIEDITWSLGDTVLYRDPVVSFDCV